MIVLLRRGVAVVGARPCVEALFYRHGKGGGPLKRVIVGYSRSLGCDHHGSRLSLPSVIMSQGVGYADQAIGTYVDALHDVWAVMERLQRPGR